MEKQLSFQDVITWLKRLRKSEKIRHANISRRDKQRGADGGHENFMYRLGMIDALSDLINTELPQFCDEFYKR